MNLTDRFDDEKHLFKLKFVKMFGHGEPSEEEVARYLFLAERTPFKKKN